MDINPKRPPIAIIPAAGRGSRLAPFPCPKELFPIGFQAYQIANNFEMRPKVIAQYIVEQCTRAAATELYIILGEGKHDIMRYFGDGSRFQTQIAYLFQEQLSGMPIAIDQAYPWAKDRQVLLGMPDTIALPPDAFQCLYQQHLDAKADLSLGCFPTSTPQKFGMVEFDPTTRLVRQTIDKPTSSHLTYMWGFACWSPSFTELLHQFVQPYLPHWNDTPPPPSECILGDAFNLAIKQGLAVQALPFPNGQFMDIGTADELDATLKKFHLQ